MFKFIKRIIGLAIIVVIVIAVIGFIRGRGLTLTELRTA